MWLPLKVRHLVLINQTALPFSSSLLLLLFLCCLFWDRNLCVPWFQLTSEPRKCFRRWGGGLGAYTQLWLLIVKECLSKLSLYQAQSAAQYGGREVHGCRKGDSLENKYEVQELQLHLLSFWAPYCLFIVICLLTQII